MAKRLDAIEKRQRKSKTYILTYSSRADSTAYYLSGGMKKEGPGVYELEWSEKPPQDDAFKLRWLRQYTPEQIEEFRQIWMKSVQERDQIALRELERLFPEAYG
jgi:hypothetical protein